MKKFAVLAGILVFCASGAAYGQEAPPPLPESGDHGEVTPASEVPPPAYPPPAYPPPGAQPYGHQQPVPVQIIAPPEPDWRFRLSLNLTLPTTIQLDIGLTPLIGILVGVGGFKILDFYWVDFVTGINFFLRGRAPKGLYVGLKLNNGWMGWDNHSFLYIFTAKALFGYNWIWRNGFSLGLGLGAQYLYVKVQDDAFKFPLDGFFVTWDLTIGWGF